jgi:gentisate 1,2-dioxygenase
MDQPTPTSTATTAPFWAIDKSNKNDEDNQLRDKRKAIPFIWKYRTDIEPLLQRSAELINTESSERRSLILVNPGLAPKRASVSTMYTAYRLNDPNDHAAAPALAERHPPGPLARQLHRRRGENITFTPATWC